MAKKIIQDVLKKEKESKLPLQPLAKSKKIFFPKISLPKSKIIFFVLGVSLVIILGAIGLINFSSAIVRISPHQEFIDIDSPMGGFKAVRGGPNLLTFEIVQLEHEESQSAPATGVSNEGQRARGEIVVYNTSSVSQKLVSQTRFQTQDGKIFRIQEPIIVPANGSIEATVYADKPGPEYNISFTDFTIPGLKGTNRYEKIYGRSKTEITGGSMGIVSLVSEEDIRNIRNNLRQKIENYLREIASKQKPNNYLLYDGALKIDFYDDPANPQAGDVIPRTDLGEPEVGPRGGDKTFVFKEKGKATGFLIKKDNLSNFLAGKYIQEKNAAKIVNLEDLTFNLLSRNPNDTEIGFSLNGRANFVWDIDTDSLIKDLMEAKAGDYDSVFKRYPRIEKAEIIFKPFWWHFIPKNKSRMNIEIVL
ncbi:MAG: hypothetical protein HY773_00290 [Candidatus Terrybacteria bacterium]|nr:hypothetical protein [Candidatus Terrybacteria bacterium]